LDAWDEVIQPYHPPKINLNVNNNSNMNNSKEAETNQPYHSENEIYFSEFMEINNNLHNLPSTLHFLKLNEINNNESVNQSVDVNNNINEDIDNVIDDMYFEPEISEPYTRRSEKQYYEDINYYENDNRLLHPPINNVEDDRYSLAPRLPSIHNRV
jgi:hypothetical protein